MGKSVKEQGVVKDGLMGAQSGHASGRDLTDGNPYDLEEAHAKSVLANEIAFAIRERCISQQRAAEITRLSQPDISRIMNGRLDEISVWRLMKAAAALGKDVSIGIYAGDGGLGRISTFSEEEHDLPPPRESAVSAPEDGAAAIRYLLRSERIRQRLSQAALATLVGRSRKWLSDYERGAADPSFADVVALASVLGVKVSFEADAGTMGLAVEAVRVSVCSEPTRPHV